MKKFVLVTTLLIAVTGLAVAAKRRDVRAWWHARQIR